MAKMPSTASSSSDTHGRIHEKGPSYKSREMADPLRVLEPERKKLTSLESQRILAVLESTIRRIEVSTIIPFVVENLSRFSIVLGAELTQFLREHGSLQGRYQKVVSQLSLEEKRLASLREKFALQKQEKEAQFFLDDECLSSIDQESTEDRSTTLDISLVEGKIKKEFKMVKFLKGQLKHSLKTMLRLFVGNPTAVDSLRHVNNERSEAANDMLRQLNALKATVFERLLRTPSELKDRNGYLKFVTEREIKLTKHAKKLREELNLATEDKENEASISAIHQTSLSNLVPTFC